MDSIFEKLESVIARVDELNSLLSDPEVISDSKRFTELSKELGSLNETAEKYSEYKNVLVGIDESKELLKDNDLGDIAKEELDKLIPLREKLESELKILMLPKDPNDNKNIIMEIRGAAGGDEANIFAGDLLSMYSKYANTQNWTVEIVDESPSEAGGFKEVVIMITGADVFSKLKYESGAHRVQRIPTTETQGRVHTSTATVAVMPEFEDIDTEGLIEEKDVREDVYRSSGAGGQHVNKTSSAIRLTHLPTGISVAMQDQRSQQQNRAKAWQILRSRVYDFFAQQNIDQYAGDRKSKVGTGDRSERIRTYNYPQNRVTDHRIGLTLNKLDRVMNGELEEIIDALIISDQTAQLEEINND